MDEREEGLGGSREQGGDGGIEGGGEVTDGEAKIWGGRQAKSKREKREKEEVGGEVRLTGKDAGG